MSKEQLNSFEKAFVVFNGSLGDPFTEAFIAPIDHALERDKVWLARVKL